MTKGVHVHGPGGLGKPECVLHMEYNTPATSRQACGEQRRLQQTPDAGPYKSLLPILLVRGSALSQAVVPSMYQAVLAAVGTLSALMERTQGRAVPADLPA